MPRARRIYQEAMSLQSLTAAARLQIPLYRRKTKGKPIGEVGQLQRCQMTWKNGRFVEFATRRNSLTIDGSRVPTSSNHLESPSRAEIYGGTTGVSKAFVIVEGVTP